MRQRVFAVQHHYQLLAAERGHRQTRQMNQGSHDDGEIEILRVHGLQQKLRGSGQDNEFDFRKFSLVFAFTRGRR